MPAHENATPIRILHNSAAHLAGPARSLGAVLMGYLGNFISHHHQNQVLCLMVLVIIFCASLTIFCH